MASVVVLGSARSQTFLPETAVRTGISGSVEQLGEDDLVRCAAGMFLTVPAD